MDEVHFQVFPCSYLIQLHLSVSPLLLSYGGFAYTGMNDEIASLPRSIIDMVQTSITDKVKTANAVLNTIPSSLSSPLFPHCVAELECTVMLHIS